MPGTGPDARRENRDAPYPFFVGIEHAPPETRLAEAKARSAAWRENRGKGVPFGLLPDVPFAALAGDKALDVPGVPFGVLADVAAIRTLAAAKGKEAAAEERSAKRERSSVGRLLTEGRTSRAPDVRKLSEVSQRATARAAILRRQAEALALVISRVDLRPTPAEDGRARAGPAVHGGRRYSPEERQRLADRWAAAIVGGGTEGDFAASVDVTPRTVFTWKKRWPEFDPIVARVRDVLGSNGRVERLGKRAGDVSDRSRP